MLYKLFLSLCKKTHLFFSVMYMFIAYRAKKLWSQVITRDTGGDACECQVWSGGCMTVHLWKDHPGHLLIPYVNRLLVLKLHIVLCIWPLVFCPLGNTGRTCTWKQVDKMLNTYHKQIVNHYDAHLTKQQQRQRKYAANQTTCKWQQLTGLAL